MNQGDVYWCDMPDPDHRRPAVILSRQGSIAYLSGLTVAPVTTRLRTGPSFVALSVDDGLFADCCVNCDSLQTIPKEALRERITTLSQDRYREIQAAIRFALGLNQIR